MNEEKLSGRQRKKSAMEHIPYKAFTNEAALILGPSQVHCNPKLIHSCSSAGLSKSWSKTKSCSETSEEQRQNKHNKINTF